VVQQREYPFCSSTTNDCIRVGNKTKRPKEGTVATIFDPLGLISPAIIKGKMLVQSLWSRGYQIGTMKYMTT
jgi:hypothetical protein